MRWINPPFLLDHHDKIRRFFFFDFFLYRIVDEHRHKGPVSFRGLRSVARIFYQIACPKNQVVLPEYYMIFFLPEYGYFKSSYHPNAKFHFFWDILYKSIARLC